MSNAKDLKRLEKIALAAGWSIKPTKSGCMFLPADKTKGQVLCHFTPSDHRAMKNTIAELRRAGLEI